jgi:UDPglucose 6-dehydrogenase
VALAANLRAAGARVLAHDPRAGTQARLADPELSVAPSALEAARGADAIIVATEWADYGRLDWHAIAAAMRGTLVYDTRGVVDVDAAGAAGLRVERLGRPSVGPVQPAGAAVPGSLAPEPATSSASES